MISPFITIGFPDVPTSVEVAAALLSSGADMLELGIPFSDPLADGTTVQKTSYRALREGVTVGTGLDVVRQLRGRGIDAPLVLMGYFNPFLSYGQEALVQDAAEAGVDGLIVPDLPHEEADPLRQLCESSGLYLIPLLAPTSTDQRIALACKRAGGFIYCVSVTGVTGARAGLSEGLEGMVARIRRHTDLPVLVGFGVSSKRHVETIRRFADGVVVASALLDAVGSAPDKEAARVAGEFVRALRPAEPSSPG